MRIINYKKNAKNQELFRVPSHSPNVKKNLSLNFSKYLHLCKHEIQFKSFEVFQGDNDPTRDLMASFEDVLNKASLIPYKNIMLGNMVIGCLSLDAKHTSVDNDIYKQIIIGLYLEYFRHALSPFSIMSYVPNQEKLSTSSWVKFILACEVEHPDGQSGAIDFNLDIDLSAIEFILQHK